MITHIEHVTPRLAIRTTSKTRLYADLSGLRGIATGVALGAAVWTALLLLIL